VGKRIGYVRQHACKELMVFTPDSRGSWLSAADSGGRKIGGRQGIDDGSAAWSVLEAIRQGP
jgi:hypothetical protein